MWSGLSFVVTLEFERKKLQLVSKRIWLTWRKVDRLLADRTITNRIRRRDRDAKVRGIKSKLHYFDLLWTCCGFVVESTTNPQCLDMSRCCVLVMDFRFAVDLLYSLLYSKSTANRISGVWASAVVTAGKQQTTVHPNGTEQQWICNQSGE